MDLNNKKWKEFIMEEVFDDIVNSKAYHKNQLKSLEDSELPYITRTTYNNGLELFVENEDYSINPKNTIVFGAESATFFYEPFDYITGNKMYYITDKNFNRYVCLFLVGVLNNVVKDGFGYSHGLTGNRLKQQRVLLPVNDNDLPDYEFMENYVKKIQNSKNEKCAEYIHKRINELNYVEVEPLSNKKWEQFYIDELFNIKSGKRLTKINMIQGNIPFIGSTALNNGITNYVSNTNESLDSNVLGVNYNGSVVENFYHPYNCIFSDDVKRFHLKNYEDNKYVLLFFKSIILQQKVKYMYGYKFNAKRMKKQIILVPVNELNAPDYEYMEQYMINLELQLLTKYLDYLTSE